jgi:hypothetical protein
MTTAIQEYSPTEQALAELRQKYAAVVFDTSTPKGMEAAKAGRAELRGYRVALEKKRVEIKAPALERSRQIDTEAKRLTAEIEALEDPIDAVIKKEEQRKEAEKAAKEQAERDRIAAVNARFDSLKALPLSAVGKGLAEIDALIEEAQAFEPETFEEDMRYAAVHERRKTIADLRNLRDAREAQDAAQAEVEKQLAELAELRAADEARRAEDARKAAEDAERLEAERRGREMAEAAAKREAEAAERAELERQRQEIADKDRQAAQERAAADAAAKAERDRLAAEQAAEAKRQAQERRQLEADQAELERQKVAKRIASTGLIEAAKDMLAQVRGWGHGECIEAVTLDAAIKRESRGKQS